MKPTILFAAAALMVTAFWTAAPSAAEGVKTAGAEASDAPSKDDAAPARKPAAKKAKKRKKKPAPVSKYKSRVLSESTEASYRFDAEGNPIGAAKKKKAAAKAKKSSEGADDGLAPDKGACSEEEPCTDKSSDADAL